MRGILMSVTLVAATSGCAEEKQYKDDPALAARIQARKEAEKAAAEAPPKPYAEVAITEVPGGRILYNCYRGRAVTMWGVTIGGEPESLKIYRFPRWAPDGQQVLVSYLGDETNRFELGLTKERGGEVMDLLFSAEHDSLAGCWSPDGSQIVYVQSHDNYGEIAIARADGSNPRLIAPHEKDDRSPTWSADGSHIAFESDRDFGCGIYVVPASGGTPERITKDSEDCGQPNFSPCGQFLAYVVTYRSAETRNWVRDLRVRRLDTQEERTLLQGAKQIVGVDWSPQGQWLVLGFEGDQQSDLCIIDVNGNGLRKITDDPHGDTSPSWRPVGREATPAPTATSQG
jgi:Tol biopolymer transport system component